MYFISQRFITLWFQFIEFGGNPKRFSSEVLENNPKSIDVCFYYATIDFTISIFLWLLTEITEKCGLFNPLNTKEKNSFSIIEIIAIGIIVAPILEEYIFRYPLKYIFDNKYFKWILYFVCLIFGLIHLSNYVLDNSHIIFAPLIVIIQIYGAFMFSFIRLKYGFWYGVLLHIIHNSWSLIWKYTIGFDL